MNEPVEPQHGAHDATTSYDEVPYSSHPFAATHPDHLYTLARLFQLDTPVPDGASILELGCAAGGNIIPVALQMPNARVVGVDLSARQIADGQARIEQLGLRNIRLLAQDFQTLDDSIGTFDYIICHGVFSWVSDAVQRRIMEICRDRLSPRGIAYISYNAYPGWHMRGMIRQMMLYHVERIPDPAQKVAQARMLLAFLVSSTEGQNTPYANFLKGELEMLSKQPDYYLFHDHLEENNRPMFFHEFHELARQHQLAFMSESSLPSMVTTNLPAKAAEALTQLTNDLIQRSQYTDFVTNRMFRQSLLCHEANVLDRQLQPSRIESGRFSMRGRVVEPSQVDNLSPEVEVGFELVNRRMLKTSNPNFKALLNILIQAYPSSLSVEQLEAAMNARLEAAGVPAVGDRHALRQVLLGNLLSMVARGDAEVRMLPDRFSGTLSERPVVSALTRLECATGAPVTTGQHLTYNPDALARLIIRMLDGSHAMGDLVTAVERLVAEGKLRVTNSQTGESPNAEVLGQANIDLVRRVLDSVRRSALLVA